MKDTLCWRRLKEENPHVQCIDCVTGKELPHPEFRQPREQDLKYLRDIGECEKVDERGCHCTVPIHPSRHQVDRHKQSIREGAFAYQVTTCGKRIQKLRSSRSAWRGLLRWKVDSNRLHRSEVESKHSQSCTESCQCVLSCKGSETCAGTSASGEKRQLRWKHRVVETKSMYGTRDAASNWQRARQEHHKRWRYQLAPSSKNLLRNKRSTEFFRNNTWSTSWSRGPQIGLHISRTALQECARSKQNTSSKLLANDCTRESEEWLHDLGHVDVLVKDLGLEELGNPVQTPAAHDVTDEEPKPLDRMQSRAVTDEEIQIASC